MRIISDFHDYYDSAQRYGQDRTLIYQRKQKEMWAKKHKLKVPAPFFQRGWHAIHYTYFFVGFCGKLYPLVKLWRHDAYDAVGDNSTHKHCYEIDHIDRWMQEHCSQEEVGLYLSNYHHKESRCPRDGHRKDFVRYFDTCQSQEPLAEKICQEERVPLFAARAENSKDYQHDTLITLNASLREFEFFRVFDTFRTYQEISMYLGNMAEPRKPIPTISDEVMAEAKGFDRFSFRKEKKR